MKQSHYVGLALALVLIFIGCAATPAPQSSAASADMTGTWDLEVVSPGGSGTPTFNLKQEGNAFSGTYAGAFGEAPVTGSVSGNTVEIKFQSMGADIVYTGTRDGNKIAGNVDFGGQGEGTFKGQKR